jgi:hypothetical protein
MGHGPEAYGRVKNILNAAHVNTGNRRIDLKWNAPFFQQLDALHGPLEGPRDLSEQVMVRLISAVQGDAYPFYPAFFHSFDDFWIQERSIRGHDHAEAQLRAALSQGEYVWAQERLAAGENDNGRPHQTDLLEDFKALGRVQFSGIGTAIGTGPAMDAIQVACSRNLPSYKP